MKRIGLAASKMAQGNIWLYHLAVVLIACLFAMFVFLVCGFCLAATIFVLSLLFERFWPSVNQKAWMDVLRMCLIFLGVVVGMMTLFAVLKNIKLRLK